MRRDASLRKSEGTIHVTARSHSARAGVAPERVRPKRRRPKRSVWRRTILPLMGYSALIACAVVMVCGASKPFMLYDREKEANQTLQKQLDNCRRENAVLERRIKYLQTPEGRAQAARELGWVKPGEITLVIPQEKPDKAKP